MRRSPPRCIRNFQRRSSCAGTGSLGVGMYMPPPAIHRISMAIWCRRSTPWTVRVGVCGQTSPMAVTYHRTPQYAPGVNMAQSVPLLANTGGLGVLSAGLIVSSGCRLVEVVKASRVGIGLVGAAVRSAAGLRTTFETRTLVHQPEERIANRLVGSLGTPPMPRTIRRHAWSSDIRASPRCGRQ